MRSLTRHAAVLVAALTVVSMVGPAVAASPDDGDGIVPPNWPDSPDEPTDCYVQTAADADHEAVPTGITFRPDPSDDRRLTFPRTIAPGADEVELSAEASSDVPVSVYVTLDNSQPRSPRSGAPNYDHVRHSLTGNATLSFPVEEGQFLRVLVEVEGRNVSEVDLTVEQHGADATRDWIYEVGENAYVSFPGSFDVPAGEELPSGTAHLLDGEMVHANRNGTVVNDSRTVRRVPYEHGTAVVDTDDLDPGTYTLVGETGYEELQVVEYDSTFTAVESGNSYCLDRRVSVAVADNATVDLRDADGDVVTDLSVESWSRHVDGYDAVTFVPQNLGLDEGEYRVVGDERSVTFDLVDGLAARSHPIDRGQVVLESDREAYEVAVSSPALDTDQLRALFDGAGTTTDHDDDGREEFLVRADGLERFDLNTAAVPTGEYDLRFDVTDTDSVAEYELSTYPWLDWGTWTPRPRPSPA
jgi:hypothetical protein